MSDWTDLKRVSLAIAEGSSLQGLEAEEAMHEFECAATPDVVLALIAENEALRKDADRYRHLKLDATDDGSLIERLDCNISIMNWDSAIDVAMGSGKQS